MYLLNIWLGDDFYGVFVFRNFLKWGDKNSLFFLRVCNINVKGKNVNNGKIWVILWLIWRSIFF